MNSSETTAVLPPAFHSTALASLTLDEWREACKRVAEWEERRNWLYADLLAEGKRFLPSGTARTEAETVAAILKLLPPSAARLRKARTWIQASFAFPPEKRWEQLTFNHHQAVMVSGLPAADQKKALRLAEKNGWSEADLREHLAPERDTEPEIRMPRFVPRVHVMDGCRFLSAVDETDTEWIAALREEYLPLVFQLKRLGIW